jgi:hypothetical protein
MNSFYGRKKTGFRKLAKTASLAGIWIKLTEIGGGRLRVAPEPRIFRITRISQIFELVLLSYLLSWFCWDMCRQFLTGC